MLNLKFKIASQIGYDMLKDYTFDLSRLVLFSYEHTTTTYNNDYDNSNTNNL